MALQDLRFNITAVDETGSAFQAAAREASTSQQQIAKAASFVAVQQEEAATASAAVTRELIVLGREGLTGNFSRLPGSVLALSERIQSAGAGVLNLRTVFGLFGSVAGAVFNPVVLGIIGFSAALEILPRLFGSIGNSLNSVTEQLKAHDELIQRIKKDWGDATAGAADYATKAGNAINKLQDVRDVQKDVDTLSASLQGELSKLAGSIEAAATFNGKQTTDAFGEMTGEALNFAHAIESGSPDLEKFRTRWLQLSINPQADAGIRAHADQLVAMSAAAAQLTDKLAGAQALLAAMTGKPLPGAGTVQDFNRVDDFGSRLRSEHQPAPTDSTADRQAKDAQRVADSLQLQINNLTRTSREQAIYNALAQAGIDDTSKLAPKIENLAGKYYDQSTALQKTIDKLDAFRSAARDALGTFASDLEQKKGVWTAFADAAVNALNRIVDNGLDQLVDMLFGAKGSASGGLFGSSLLTDVGHLLGFASGGSVTVGGAGGPDSQLFAARVSPGERIDFTPPGKDGRGGGEITVHIASDAPEWLDSRIDVRSTTNAVKVVTEAAKQQARARQLGG